VPEKSNHHPVTDVIDRLVATAEDRTPTTFTPGGNDMKKALTLTIVSLALVASSAFVYAQEELVYVAVEPCRVADTRQSAMGVIRADTSRNFHVSGSSGDLAAQGGEVDCPNPRDGELPVAVSAYILAVPASSSSDKGVLSAYPSDEPPPPTGSGSTVNFDLGQTIGNTTNATVCSGGDCPSDGQLAVLARKTDEHVVIDIQGYFYRESVPGYQVVEDSFAVANSDGFIATLDCPAGKKVLGGGGTLLDGSWFMQGSYPKADGSGWRVRYRTSGATFSAAVTVWAVCASVN